MKGQQQTDQWHRSIFSLHIFSDTLLAFQREAQLKQRGDSCLTEMSGITQSVHKRLNHISLLLALDESDHEVTAARVAPETHIHTLKKPAR